jgi:NAD(P)-dependent dehydrogenase (short-subunit alcohol dehydrogenase family)
LQTDMKVNAIDPGPIETDMLKSIFPGELPQGTRKTEDVVPAFLDAVSEDCKAHGEIILA